MASGSVFIKYWRILIISFILIVLSSEIIQSAGKFNVNIIKLGQNEVIFIELVIGTLTASLVLYFFIKLVSKYVESKD